MGIFTSIQQIKITLISSVALFFLVLITHFFGTPLSTFLYGVLALLAIISCLFILHSLAKIHNYITQLQTTEKQTKKNLNNLKIALASKEQNIKELSALNYALNQTVLYARVTTDGTIISIGERFSKLIKSTSNHNSKNLVEFIGFGELQKNRILQLIAQDKGGVFNEEFEFKTNTGKRIWLDISILSVFKKSGNVEKLVLCSDISKRKEAQQEVEHLRTIQYHEQEELQKTNASLIIEAQEEERKRIAKEIHDSIGQMLTALKFNIESINTAQVEKMNLKIEGLKKLSKDLIRGVRTATFNLTPPELKDYGIAKALQKMTRELSKLTDKHIIFEDQTHQILRFDSLVETNLYRVSQEAINNAIKYAKSSYIMVSINTSEDLLSITIDDNGKGFDSSKIPLKPKNNAEGGMGLFFMKERMNYINGRIFISSILGKGTRITLNYPIINT